MEQGNASLMELFAALPEAQKENILSSLTEEEIYYLQYDWQLLARPAQRIPPGDWFTWLLRSGERLWEDPYRLRDSHTMGYAGIFSYCSGRGRLRQMLGIPW